MKSQSFTRSQSLFFSEWGLLMSGPLGGCKYWVIVKLTSLPYLALLPNQQVSIQFHITICLLPPLPPAKKKTNLKAYSKRRDDSQHLFRPLSEIIVIMTKYVREICLQPVLGNMNKFISHMQNGLYYSISQSTPLTFHKYFSIYFHVTTFNCVIISSLYLLSLCCKPPRVVEMTRQAGYKINK